MTNCIIVDDELPARELIMHYLSGLNQFTLLNSFDNAPEAFHFLQHNTVDLMFLDIQMPGMSGLQLLQSLQSAPKVILTTAYREFAADAFELDALDYLLKPITQERFMRAVSKFNHVEISAAKQPNTEAYIFLKTGKEQTKVFLKDITYIEGLKDYVKVHTLSKVFVASERLSYMEQKLPEGMFSRIHKSFIVSLEKITHYKADEVVIGGTSLPLGRVFKSAFLGNLKTK